MDVERPPAPPLQEVCQRGEALLGDACQHDSVQLTNGRDSLQGLLCRVLDEVLKGMEAAWGCSQGSLSDPEMLLYWIA